MRRAVVLRGLLAAAGRQVEAPARSLLAAPFPGEPAAALRRAGASACGGARGACRSPQPFGRLRRRAAPHAPPGFAGDSLVLPGPKDVSEAVKNPSAEI